MPRKPKKEACGAVGVFRRRENERRNLFLPRMKDEG